MIKNIVLLLLCFPAALFSQKNDTTIKVNGKVITLSEIVINSKLNVPSFIERVKNDTTFYKAFRNLHILNFTAINDVRMLNKSGEVIASLNSKIKQLRSGNCRTMQVLEEKTTGDIYDENKN